MIERLFFRRRLHQGSIIKGVEGPVRKGFSMWSLTVSVIIRVPLPACHCLVDLEDVISV